ncbi:MAG: pyridoxal-phosphate dependent enzyme [Deltaproteobacteria bacterium]|nr:MAG: pyridoxal-phosphate dependent enzyme [Deltaproteobacteria bacterium]
MAHVRLDLGCAYRAVRRHLAPTPLVRSSWAGASLKLECLQQTGAYKVRGALAALTAQVERGDHRPVIAASAGNHAAGMAWAARALGLDATAVVPEDAPATKVARTEALGARVIRHGDSFEAAAAHARTLAAQRGWRLLHPFDDPDIVAGQCTVGVELWPHAPDVVVVPVGGGGLAAGVAIAFAGRGTRVVGVRVRRSERMTSIADGVRVQHLGDLNARLLHRHLDELITVSDAEVRSAMRRLYVEDGLITEGAGAVAVAGLARVHGSRRVAVVSGGNIDLSLFRAVTTARAA